MDSLYYADVKEFLRYLYKKRDMQYKKSMDKKDEMNLFYFGRMTMCEDMIELLEDYLSELRDKS